MLNKFSWLQNEAVQKIIKSLTVNNNPTFQFVGGCVRDSLLNKQTYDFDIASVLEPTQNINLLKSNNINVVCNAVKYGTVTAIVNNLTFEITTLRKDIISLGRKAVVAKANSFREDAKRRDFTINALYLNPFTLKLTDYFNGITDLKNGKIRFIGNIENRITEDYLRILRFIRFYTYFGKNRISTKEINILKKYLNKLTILSKERITSELNKIINHSNYIKGIKLLNRLEISNLLFKQKNLNINKLIRFNALIQEYNIESSIPTTINFIKWIVLLDNLNTCSIKFLNIPKQDKYFINIYKKITIELFLQKKSSYFLARYDTNYIENTIAALLVKINKRNNFYSYLFNLLNFIKQKKGFKFSITGEDLIKLNIPQNKNFGKILIQLKEWGIENNITNKEHYMEKAKDFYSKTILNNVCN